ncbi:MAG TPA: DUF4290 domain-containing protein [Saprospiraceae bacterium]|nr:DUF4290 domain-containing protein [Saprospiraceae bacterium]HPI05512.1 DUF4290 domain-containing protein [Saprospiraceae bacterium]
MNRLDIEYNTERSHIRFPEYGRSIQEMIIHAKNIENPGLRQKTVESIVGLMIQLGPSGNKNMDDYREKLWNHVFEIADYELDATPPPGIIIRRVEERAKAAPLGYPASATRYRHYGNSIQALIKKAIEMPEGSKKEGFVEVIASYMKLAYKTWNKEHYVSDDIVKEDLENLSDGQLALHEGHDSLDKLAAGAGKHDKDRIRSNSNNQRNRKQRPGGGNNGNQRNNRNSNSSNQRNNGGNFRKRKK